MPTGFNVNGKESAGKETDYCDLVVQFCEVVQLFV
ncbi:Uncharacterised protein [Plesiomonas shigelloides]|nr:Uncharacterised protein [Plesiomonas shigelloides]